MPCPCQQEISNFQGYDPNVVDCFGRFLKNCQTSKDGSERERERERERGASEGSCNTNHIIKDHVLVVMQEK